MTVSEYIEPDTVEPSPYWIENVPVSFWEVEDELALYLCLLEHAVELHSDEGTQRSEEPATNKNS